MNEYEASCLGKTRFYTRTDAKKRANEIRIRGYNHAKLRPYKCWHCGLHHLGHRPGEATYLRTTPTGVIPVQEYRP